MTTEPLLYEFIEAGALLRVGRTTIYGLVDRDELRAVKIGRRSLITAESLRAYVDRLSAGAEVA
jgi:excisionase family DNA binding protein